MKLAISIDTNEALNSQTAHHFGRCPYFALVELEGRNVKYLDIIDNPFYESHQPGQVPEFIKGKGVQVMISGGMGRKALDFFKGYEIDVKTGATGSLQEVINAFIAGDLQEGSSCAHSNAHHHGDHHH
jgi:predicted Fe-Mo cluster-binding NifX family protein